jgi:acyl-coenzyme A thioesterase PaaI-like protein
MTDIEVPSDYEICDMPDGEFAAAIGPLFIRQSDSGPIFAFRAESRHTNARGVVHGGMLMSFADQALGLTIQRALNTLDLATASLNCNLAASARPGDLIESAATITRITKRIIFIKGTVTCGEVVLMDASGIWVRIRPSA